MLHKMARRTIYSKSFNEEMVPYQPKSKFKYRLSTKVVEARPGKLDGIKVLTHDGKEVLLSDTWRNKTIVLKVLARLGCGMCRYEAKILSSMKPLLENCGVALVAVAFEDLDLEEFLSCGYWQWDILLDPERQVYKAAGLVKLGLVQSILGLLGRRVGTLATWLGKRGVDYNLKGDIRQLGGTFIISPEGEIIYEFRPSKLAMFPSFKDIIEISGGDPDDIEDELPPEYVFPQRRMSKLK